jgi:phosphoribosylanthranilate isomerase
MTRVKICGVTSVEDAMLCVDAGADAIGLNFAPESVRCLSLASAERIVAALPSRVLTVGVFVDADEATLRQFNDALGLGCLQLHGDEPPELLARFLPHAFKALRVRGDDVAADAARYPGEHLLLDAYVPGHHGGTGARFDWHVAAQLAAARRITLAGGLTPDNVAQAIRVAAPYCVDVASGVESRPGKKDPQKVRAFMRAVRAADGGSGS